MRHHFHEERPEPQQKEFLERLGSLDEIERQQAETAIEEMGEEGIEKLLAVVQSEAEKRRKQKRMQRLFLQAVLGIYAVILTAFVVRGVLTSDWDFESFGSFFFFITLFGGAAAASQLHKNAACLLAKHDDIRAVGPLAEALEIEDGDIRAVCRETLTRLLPRLQASDGGLLSPEQRDNLNQTLKKASLKQDTEFILAILQAWQQVGDEKALPHVERLGQLKNNSEAGQRVREAAQACLPFLQERVEKARQAGTLLRPAESPNNFADSLLRPAPGAACADPQLLLRPASQGNTEPPVGI
jgi:hypothetical protein